MYTKEAYGSVGHQRGACWSENRALRAGCEAGRMASPWLQQHCVPVVGTMSGRAQRTQSFWDPESGRQLLQTTLTRTAY